MDSESKSQDQVQLVVAKQLLNEILQKLTLIDIDLFFQEQVDETQAPKYYQIVQKPMYFQLMRTKLDTKQYQTWQNFQEDFKLIYQNALQYNLKRTKHYKAAQNLQKNGRKVLKDFEFQGRKAFTLLFPDQNQGYIIDAQTINKQSLDLEDLVEMEFEQLDDFPILQKVKQSLAQVNAEPHQHSKEQVSPFLPENRNISGHLFGTDIFDLGKYETKSDLDDLELEYEQQAQQGIQEVLSKAQPKTSVEDIHTLSVDCRNKNQVDEAGLKKTLHQLQTSPFDSQPIVWASRNILTEAHQMQNNQYKQNLEWRLGWLFQRIIELEHEEHTIQNKLTKIDQKIQAQKSSQQQKLHRTSQNHTDQIAIPGQSLETQAVSLFDNTKSEYPTRKRKRVRNGWFKASAIVHHPFFLQHTAFKASRLINRMQDSEFERYNNLMLNIYIQDQPLKQLNLDRLQQDIPARVYRAADILSNQMHIVLDRILENVQLDDFKQQYLPISTQFQNNSTINNKSSRQYDRWQSQRHLSHQRSQNQKLRKFSSSNKQLSNGQNEAQDFLDEGWQKRKFQDLEDQFSIGISLQQMSRLRVPQKLQNEEITIPSVRELSYEEQLLPMEIKENIQSAKNVNDHQDDIKSLFKSNDLYKKFYLEEGSSEELTEDEQCLDRHGILEQQEISHINTVADTLMKNRRTLSHSKSINAALEGNNNFQQQKQ